MTDPHGRQEDLGAEDGAQQEHAGGDAVQSPDQRVEERRVAEPVAERDSDPRADRHRRGEQAQEKGAPAPGARPQARHVRPLSLPPEALRRSQRAQ